jgi:hypothetical protein
MLRHCCFKNRISFMTRNYATTETCHQIQSTLDETSGSSPERSIAGFVFFKSHKIYSAIPHFLLIKSSIICYIRMVVPLCDNEGEIESRGKHDVICVKIVTVLTCTMTSILSCKLRTEAYLLSPISLHIPPVILIQQKNNSRAGRG